MPIFFILPTPHHHHSSSFSLSTTKKNSTVNHCYHTVCRRESSRQLAYFSSSSSTYYLRIIIIYIFLCVFNFFFFSFVFVMTHMLFAGEAWYNAQWRARQPLELQYFCGITRWNVISRLSTITTLSSRKESKPTRITEILLQQYRLTIPIEITINWDII